MNATRFYWAKLQGAEDQFLELESKTEEAAQHNVQNTNQVLHNVQNTCCELINEFRCPRFVQIEARVGNIHTIVFCMHSNLLADTTIPVLP